MLEPILLKQTFKQGGVEVWRFFYLFVFFCFFSSEQIFETFAYLWPWIGILISVNFSDFVN